MVKSEDVTPGFWYVKYYQRMKEEEIETYSIVEVLEGREIFNVAVPGSSEPYTLKEFEFIAPVPPPKES